MFAAEYRKLKANVDMIIMETNTVQLERVWFYLLLSPSHLRIIDA